MPAQPDLARIFRVPSPSTPSGPVRWIARKCLVCCGSCLYPAEPHTTNRVLHGAIFRPEVQPTPTTCEDQRRLAPDEFDWFHSEFHLPQYGSGHRRNTVSA